jgi:hypothetical protein
LFSDTGTSLFKSSCVVIFDDKDVKEDDNSSKASAASVLLIFLLFGGGGSLLVGAFLTGFFRCALANGSAGSGSGYSSVGHFSSLKCCNILYKILIDSGNFFYISLLFHLFLYI